MNKENLKIIITSVDKEEYYDQFMYSDENDINVNNSDYGFLILFRDEEFKKIQPPTLLVNIKKIMESNLPDSNIIFTFMYDGINIDQLTLMGLLHIDFTLGTNNEALSPMIYLPSDQLTQVAQRVLSDESSDDSRFKMPKEKKYKPVNPLSNNDIPAIMRDIYDVDISDGKGKGKKKRRKKGSKYKNHSFDYSSSRVLRATKNPKKSFKKHGIIICNSKKAIHKDEDIIKDFLKDFIPGNSSFKKDLRKKLLRRWMSSYVINKKQATRIKKKYNKAINKSIKDQKVQQVVNMTRKILTVPIDNWSDPSK